MKRITERDLMGMLNRVTRSLRTLGVDITGIRINIGSRTNGVAFRIYRLNPVNHGQANLIMPDGFLGTTKREAYDTLHTMAQTLEFVVMRQETSYGL